MQLHFRYYRFILPRQPRRRHPSETLMANAMVPVSRIHDQLVNIILRISQVGDQERPGGLESSTYAAAKDFSIYSFEPSLSVVNSSVDPSLAAKFQRVFISRTTTFFPRYLSCSVMAHLIFSPMNISLCEALLR